MLIREVEASLKYDASKLNDIAKALCRVGMHDLSIEIAGIAHGMCCLADDVADEIKENGNGPNNQLADAVEIPHASAGNGR